MGEVHLKLADVQSFLHVISDSGTLYKVESGQRFRLIDSNRKARNLGIGSKDFHGKLISEFLPREHYLTYDLPQFKKVLETRASTHYTAPSPYYEIQQGMNVHMAPVFNKENECSYILVISKYQHSEKDLEYLAFHDPLTGIPNRLFLEERMKKAMVRYQHHGIPYSAMIIDCDKFKWINDHFGHEGGDQALVTVAKRLKNCIRNEDVFARYGGDEFAVLLENCVGEQAVEVAERMLETTRNPVMLRDSACEVTISIGIAYSGDPCGDENIMSLADRALYGVKSDGRNHFKVFNSSEHKLQNEKV